MKLPPRAAAVMAVVWRPALWSTAVSQVLLLAGPGWWRRWPPVPAPDQAYWHFRMETAYGSGDAFPGSGDVVAYLSWCRAMNKMLRVKHAE